MLQLLVPRGRVRRLALVLALVMGMVSEIPLGKVSAPALALGSAKVMERVLAL